jgi:hypothetical protein
LRKGHTLLRKLDRQSQNLNFFDRASVIILERDCWNTIKKIIKLHLFLNNSNITTSWDKFLPSE